MTANRISDMIGIHYSNYSEYKKKGILPEPPSCWRDMTTERLACYVRICKKIVNDYRARRGDMHKKRMKEWGRSRKKTDWSLPSYYRAAIGTEGEIYLDKKLRK